MRHLVISAPFGNCFKDANATSTLGTFTHEFRGGVLKRLWRAARTVRYYPGIGAWKNQMGLPNPGIDWLSTAVGAGSFDVGRVDASDKIVSVSARETSDWNYLLGTCKYLIRPAYVELNVSCPNCPGEFDHSDYEVVFTDAATCFPGRAIVKLPPINYLPILRQALACGLTGFHCCNTLPIPEGGLSGKPLQPLALEAVRTVRETAECGGFALTHLIGGGGVTGLEDARRFLAAGATSVAVGSVLFFPWKWRTVRRMAFDLAADHP